MSGVPLARTILVTGAAGALGRQLCASLPALGWTVRGFDIVPAPPSSAEMFVGSVEDLDLLERASSGVDAIVHFGGVANPGSPWASYLNVNIGGTWNVLEVARRLGIPRVLIASSNHASGYTARAEGLSAGVRSRPDSLYGVSKAAMESLGAFYADEYGLETTSVRIGSCLPRPDTVRSLSTWLSYADLGRLVVAAVAGPWGGHSTVWGISRNTRRWWSLAEGERIGYHPEDDAELFADRIPSTPADKPFVGGAAPPFPNSTPDPS